MDRVCASTEWQGHFPSAKVSHLQVSYFDHDPILLDTQCCAQHARARRKWLYRFEERWAAHQGCKEVIREAWNYHPTNGSLMFKLFEKIKRCRMKLVAWSQEVFSNTRICLKDKQAALKALSPTGYKTNLAQINYLRDEINTSLH